VSRIRETFRRLKKNKKKAFMPYIMAGDEGLEKTLQRILLLEECGADLIELGVPFSDPLADGPTIQRAAERALSAGVTLRKVLPFVKKLRDYSQIPIVLMTYYNPVYKYGESFFIEDAIQSGVDGVIIPDLPPDEASNYIRGSRQAMLDTIFLIAPTSTERRIKKIVAACSGFIYYVSITGITGSRLVLEESFRRHINKVREFSDKPVAVGFGVSTPEDARTIAEIADGVIVGSAIVKKFHEHPDEARHFVEELRKVI